MTTLFCRLYFNFDTDESYWTIDQKVFYSYVTQAEDEVLPNGETAEVFEVEGYHEIEDLPKDIPLTRDVQLEYIGKKELDYDQIIQLAVDYITGRAEQRINNDFKVIEEQKTAN